MELVKSWIEDPDAERVVNENGGSQSKLDADWKYLPWSACREIVKMMMENGIEYGGRYPYDNWRLIPSDSHRNHMHQHIIAATVIKHGSGDVDDELVHAVHAACRGLMWVESLLEERLKRDTVDIDNR